MKILSYSPSVEAYVATGNGYVDVTDDITSCVVNRHENAVSTCTISLMNKGLKYNGAFEPFDRITVFATKKESREQIFTGYISSVTRFTLYEHDFKITAKCSIYQLERVYWDPGLMPSAKLKMRFDFGYIYDAGMKSIITALITEVGGWDEKNVLISDSVPEDIEDYARDAYRKAVSTSSQFDIYGILG